LPLGTHSYTILAICPSLSTVIDSSLGRLSGAILSQTSEPDSADNFFRLRDFWDVDQAFSQVSLWGSDGSDIYRNAANWTHEMSVSLLAPAATVSGTVHLGYINIGELYNSEEDADLDLTVNKLIARSTKHVELTADVRGFTISNAMVNNNLVQSMSMSTSDLVTGFNKFASEYIAYAVIVRPFEALGVPVQQTTAFTMEITNRANYVANVIPGSAFAQSIGAKISSEIPKVDVQPVDLTNYAAIADFLSEEHMGIGTISHDAKIGMPLAYSPIQESKPNWKSNLSKIWSFIKKAGAAGSTALQTFEHVAPLLLAETPSNKQDAANYRFQLSLLLRVLGHPTMHERYGAILPVIHSDISACRGERVVDTDLFESFTITLEPQ